MLAAAENPWGLDLWILRSAMEGRHLGGNKAYKLQGYLARARHEGFSHLITMAGPHSNHLRAFAAITRREGLIGTAIIRGDELADHSRHSDEIRFAHECGVRLIFAPRQIYRALRETSTAAERAVLVPDLDFKQAIFVPEGGLGTEALMGVARWAKQATGFDTIFLPCATGATCAGFLAATTAPTQIHGVAVLRNFPAVNAAIAALVPQAAQRFALIEDYATGRFGGAVDIGAEAGEFARVNGLVVDGIYTARLLSALHDRARAGHIRGRTLLVYTYNE
ncbi:MAG: pyridoxal-phosphate dependent enzyme [Turneriella sp.]